MDGHLTGEGVHDFPEEVKKHGGKGPRLESGTAACPAFESSFQGEAGVGRPRVLGGVCTLP